MLEGSVSTRARNFCKSALPTGQPVWLWVGFILVNAVAELGTHAVGCTSGGAVTVAGTTGDRG
jgi:hypothetical protein